MGTRENLRRLGVSLLGLEELVAIAHVNPFFQNPKRPDGLPTFDAILEKRRQIHHIRIIGT